MAVQKEIKSQLAKLLATEDIVVEHKQCETAQFNVETRVLTLPLWEKASNDVYDMLVGHEVGHALFTPNDWSWEGKIPQQFVNVCEDARIEKLMKRRYLGIAKSFYRGYSELHDKDFFEVEDADLSTFNLADRANLYFKIGSFLDLSFSDAEKEIITLIQNAETFTDTISAAETLYNFCKQEQQKKTPQSQEDGEEDMEDELPPSVSSGTGSADSDSTDDNGSSISDSDSDAPVESGSSNPNTGSRNSDSNDEPTVETAEAFNSSIQDLINYNGTENAYIERPDLNIENIIASNKDVHKEIDYHWSQEREIFKERQEKYHHLPVEIFEEVDADFAKFKRDAQKEVSYLVKEFEMKKKASEYSREQVNKTGVINTNKLFSYKWTDDIFLKKTVVPTGKNHGLIMYIDWSGSMHENIEGAVKQLINLISFCKKVSIPCQVFAFTDTRHYDVYEKYEVKLDNEIVVPNNFQLVELYSSKIKHSDFDRHLFRIWVLMKSLVRRSHYCPYSLGSTPLNESILAAPYIFKKFKSAHKVDKVNTVFLTDGESNYPVIGRRRDLEDEERSYLSRKSLAYNYYESVMCFKDPKSGYSMIDIGKGTNWQSRGYAITTAFIKYYKWITGSNVIGFRLSQPSDIKHIIRATNNNDNTYRREWSKNKHFIIDCLGYNELYVLESSSDFNGEKAVIQAENGATKSKIRNQFKKYMKTKMFNKIILSKFVAQIA